MAELHIEKKQRSSALWLTIALVIIAVVVYLLSRPRETRTETAAPPVGALTPTVSGPMITAPVSRAPLYASLG